MFNGPVGRYQDRRVSGLACVFASPGKWVEVLCHDETVQMTWSR
jgi:hypothetical protein